ncbi:YpjP family protein [Metabacillus bambusae]|uniref:YpjP family protein n=1 Tax=Metabacillus bambusae TaxID=2795218 RepID=A0ABS3NCB5_9BACI|nr:YpjP family protein [Metabacillus bambusae]MBO1515619.1 YpjP family protein [Metabacillus bambusae]
MNKWLRKSLVILFSIATFGLVTPPASLAVQDKPSEDSVSKSSINNNNIDQILPPKVELEQLPLSKDQVLINLLTEAEQKSFIKFGDKIGGVIEDEFKEMIFPKMEEIITYYLNVEDDELFQQLEISKPSGGTGEKIFHIYNTITGEDVLRFHVRRENRPLEGYWFNFHYHTYHDSFQSHKDLGSIFWDKNTPPNWMSYH